MFYLFECAFTPSQGQKELPVTVPPDSLLCYMCLSAFLSQGRDGRWEELHFVWHSVLYLMLCGCPCDLFGSF